MALQESIIIQRQDGIGLVYDIFRINQLLHATVGSPEYVKHEKDVNKVTRLGFREEILKLGAS